MWTHRCIRSVTARTRPTYSDLPLGHHDETTNPTSHVFCVEDFVRRCDQIDNDKTSIALALVYGYDRLRKYDQGVLVASKLQEQFSESDTAFRWHAFFLRASGRSGEGDALAQERLRRSPGDTEALRQMEFNAIAREDYTKARDIGQEIVKEGKGTASELNQIAWYSLFTKVTDSDIDAALKAAQLSDNAWEILHTLGCLYAEVGKLKEAREVLVQAMDSANFDDPLPSFWYAFGRVAEQAGERDLALADYARVTIPGP